ncbi:MAG TPA: oligopeptide:H+ symporter [Steroidobacteraceae bacterium]|nr:oligopeptide:H+ symporter [Steroidobacteraceae bacterium]
MNISTGAAAASTGGTPSRPRAFAALFLIEMWERFGYYGMQVLLVVFMIEYLHFTDSRANLTWGALAAMVYATPVLGGWIGDKVLGARRTTMLGAIVLGLGYLLLSVPWDRVIAGAWASPLLFFSMGVIATGNGLFKANPNNLVSRLYEGEPSRLDGAFTMYYMAINVGAMISQALTPWIRVHYGWHWAFLACALGLVIGIAQFRLQRRLVAHIGSAPDFQPLRLRRVAAVLGGTLVLAVLIALIVQNLTVARAIVWLGAAALLGLFTVLIARGQRGERSGLIAMLVLTAQSMLFFIFYQQMSTSLTLFALHNVRLDFLGYHVPPEQFQWLNPFWIAVLSPLLALLYGGLGRHGRDPSVAGKYAWGFVLLALGFFIYAISGRYAVAGLVSPWWMVWGYLFQSFGELLISGLGLAMVARYVGPGRRGLMMGAWLLATGIAQYLGSFVANFASVPSDITAAAATLPRYTHLFWVLGWVAVGGTAAAIALLPLMHRLDVGHRAGGAAAAAGVP